MKVLEVVLPICILIFWALFCLTFLMWLDHHYDTHHTDFLRKLGTKNESDDNQISSDQKNIDNPMT